MTKRGRPKGTTKLPPSYFVDLIVILQEWGGLKRRQLSRVSRNIFDQGGVKWTNPVTGETVAKLTNLRALRQRLTEAKHWRRNLKITSSEIIATEPTPTPMASPDIVFTGTANVSRPRQTALKVGRKNLHK